MAFAKTYDEPKSTNNSGLTLGEIEKECKICGNTMFDHFMEVNDYFLTNEKFNLVKCKNCELVFVNPRPSHHDIAKYYNSPNYISHSGTNKGIINWVYTKIRNYTHQKKLKLVSAFTSIGIISSPVSTTKSNSAFPLSFVQ